MDKVMNTPNSIKFNTNEKRMPRRGSPIRTRRPIRQYASLPAGTEDFHFVLQILKGNVNTYLAEKRFLQPAIVARRVRILPSNPRWRTVCMRVELYGCPFEGWTNDRQTEKGIFLS